MCLKDVLGSNIILDLAMGVKLIEIGGFCGDLALC